MLGVVAFDKLSKGGKVDFWRGVPALGIVLSAVLAVACLRLVSPSRAWQRTVMSVMQEARPAPP